MVICDDDSGRGAQNWASLHFYRNFFDNLYINSLICITKYIEMRKEYLGEFEELVLTIVAVLQDDAYGIRIVNEIKERVGRHVNLSAVRSEERRVGSECRCRGGAAEDRQAEGWSA